MWALLSSTSHISLELRKTKRIGAWGMDIMDLRGTLGLSLVAGLEVETPHGSYATCVISTPSHILGFPTRKSHLQLPKEPHLHFARRHDFSLNPQGASVGVCEHQPSRFACWDENHVAEYYILRNLAVYTTSTLCGGNILIT